MEQYLDDYEVKLDLFEGPLDLLLFLVRKSEVEVSQISVSEISKQYLKYIDVMRNLNINVASEYLSMAATLIRLKAQELLPDAESEALDDDEESIINRQQLIEKLLEYKKFKEAAGSLKIYESEHFGSFGRGKHEQIEAVLEDGIDESPVAIFDLIEAFQRVIERNKDQDNVVDRHVITEEDVHLDDRLEHIIMAVDDFDEVLFDDLFKDDPRRMVIVVTFMAILELVKLNKITFRQEKQFGHLYVRSKE